MKAETAAESQERLSSHPGWALVLAGVPLGLGLWAGPLFLDDAYITFRYAENIAAGRGFVYNSDPVLGTTTPLYCLLLSAARFLGAPVERSALVIGLLAAAVTPLLIWQLGKEAERPSVGLLGGLLLALFPTWWLHALSGMETTLAAALATGTILLDLQKRPLTAGTVSGLLLLTRPDAAFLPALLFLLRLPRSWEHALRFALSCGVVLLPWLIFAFLYFGSPLPDSLAAKKLIHAFPFHRALWNYLSWFGAITQPPGLLLLTILWLAGATTIVREWREGIVVVLWPPLFFLGLALTQVGPFFWYKMPSLPFYFLAAAWGASSLGTLSAQGPAAGRKNVLRRSLRWAAGGMVTVFLVGQLASAGPYLWDRSRREVLVEKESLLREQAQLITARSQQRGWEPREVKVFAGEVGVLGFVLKDFQMIDSAGINSPEILAARRRDWENLKAVQPGAGWREKWHGTPVWSREIIRTEEPHYIASNESYLHLLTLEKEPDFLSRYHEIDRRVDTAHNMFVVWERKKE